MLKGRVVKVLSDRFMVDVGNESVQVKSRKKLKREILPLPGDFVLLEQAGGEYVLYKIEERKNRLIRPAVSNADKVIITVAPLPETDFLTVDKLIIGAHKAGVSTVICVNKTDITPQGFTESVEAQYAGVADAIVAVCAERKKTAALEKLLTGGFSCFAGQSAVGKTSLINAVCGLDREVGDLSEKTLKGKNTTTSAELIKISDGTYIADTPGFAALDLFDIKPEELSLYYDEYVALSSGCKYHMCTHVSEPNCAVRAAVESGRLNGLRYERYLMLCEELKKCNLHRKSWRKAYDD